MRRLPIVCSQTYDGMDMVVVACTRCGNWKGGRCVVIMGCEHLPMVSAEKIPSCHLESTCQHQIQARPSACPVRARGMICESALAAAGDPDPANHELSFHAMVVAGPDELEP